MSCVVLGGGRLWCAIIWIRNQIRLCGQDFVCERQKRERESQGLIVKRKRKTKEAKGNGRFVSKDRKRGVALCIFL